jgi:hypothetical protein
MEKYMQKSLKCQAERLACRDQVILMKWREARVLLMEATCESRE